MISEDRYKQAVEDQEAAQEIINQYFKEMREQFKERLESGEPFDDDELLYSRRSLCPCGHGLAYPKNCGPSHYWDCSAILKGIAEPGKDKHTAQLPFAFYNVKGERDNETTRGVFHPKEDIDA